MSKQSKEQYLESCRIRYPSRNRAGKGAMLEEVCDTLGWSRKHATKALNRQVSHGAKALKRGSKPVYTEAEAEVIIEIWKRSEQPCGKRLKQTLPLWLESYEKRHGLIESQTRAKILRCSARQLDRITAPCRANENGRKGRNTGRRSHRLKQSLAIRCGPWDVDEPGWLEADTVSHGGGSSSGLFMWSLTLTDIHTGWTELAGLWGNTGGEVCKGLGRIEARMPFEMLGFDTDNGSEFLNTVLEYYLLSKTRKIDWTHSRPYKKNDQAHVEQKNFTHVRQLLGYGRLDDPRLVELVNELYETVWLPLRNYFTPAMKLVEKRREGSKWIKTYDEAKTPCDRMLECVKVKAGVKRELEKTRAKLDPMELSDELEQKLEVLFDEVARIEEQKGEELEWEREMLGILPHPASAGAGSVPASVALAPEASTPPAPAEPPCQTITKKA